ncbi:MAG: Redoxin domain protein [Firmicutes bacterium]|nr:Redoxin domain protein [Bacillota bacterium]
MIRKSFFIIIGVIMVALGYWYTLLDDDTNKPLPSNENGVKVGQTLTPFILESLDGSQVKVGQPGKITVINFWATWCPPCVEEMPTLEGFSQNNQQKIDFYAVNLQEPNGKISDFMNKNQYTMTVLLDKNGSIGKKFQVTAIPTTIIVNKHGMVKYRKSGAMTRIEIEGIINSL